MYILLDEYYMARSQNFSKSSVTGQSWERIEQGVGDAIIGVTFHVHAVLCIIHCCNPKLESSIVLSQHVMAVKVNDSATIQSDNSSDNSSSESGSNPESTKSTSELIELILDCCSLCLKLLLYELYLFKVRHI